MLRKIFILMVSLSAAPGRGQLVDLLFPRAAESVRGVTDALTRSPMVNRPLDFTGDLLGNALNLFSALPIAAARSLGVGNGIPSIMNDNNIASLGDNFIAEYNFGLSNEDCKLSCDQLIAKYGHPVEKHEVATEDGYVLTLFRIPSKGPVVFLQHGLLGSSDDFVIAGPDTGIAYLLAKDGYDVWLGNSRGNKHSRRHVEMDPSQGNFWDFSWHEVGYYDLPAMIDHVLNSTDQETLKYIGHSQGTTSFFVMGSERPEYNDKISLMIALSPGAFMSHLKSPFVRLLAPTGGLIHAFAKTIGLHELLPDNNAMRLLRQFTCAGGPLSEILCANILFLAAGFNVEQLNVTNLPVIYSHVPSGGSAKQAAHYGQGVISAKFRQFDYGSAENLARYGTEQPPDYNLKNLRAPVSLFYSDADWLSDPRDVDELYNKLPNVVDIHKVPDKNFNHLDYVFAKDLKYLIYKRLRKLLSQF